MISSDSYMSIMHSWEKELILILSDCNTEDLGSMNKIKHKWWILKNNFILTDFEKVCWICWKSMNLNPKILFKKWISFVSSIHFFDKIVQINFQIIQNFSEMIFSSRGIFIVESIEYFWYKSTKVFNFLHAKNSF